MAIATAIVSPTEPFGWLGAIVLAVLGSFTLWRAGSIRAWKETAQARAERVEDLERELGEMRVELAIPERFAELLGVMGDMAIRQDAAAAARLEEAFTRLDSRWVEFNAAAEARSTRLETLIREALRGS